jgi:hypothetical protein
MIKTGDVSISWIITSYIVTAAEGTANLRKRIEPLA